MKLPRGHTPQVTADGRVEVHRHDEEGLARGGFGERMLRSLGWRDGDGLGVGRQGRAEAVRVTQKLDNKGVRAREVEERGREERRERAQLARPKHERRRRRLTPPKKLRKTKQKHPSGRRQQGDRPRD